MRQRICPRDIGWGNRAPENTFNDQQRADTIGALGNPHISTPNLDRLVGEGVAFTNAYSPSPVCVPARAAMHYGQYPARTRCLGNIHAMPDSQDSYVDCLARAGYRTVGVGKCHFTPDRLALRGFQQRYTQEEAPACVADDDYLQFLQSSPYHDVRDAHGTWREMLYMPQTSPLDTAHHPSQWVADRTIDVIRSAGHEPDQPWFIQCSFIHPHPPYSPPVPWDMMYEVEQMPAPYLPDDFLARQPAFKKAQLHHYFFDPPTSTTLWQIVRSRYYACVSFVDHQIGRIMEALERTGQLEHTTILFCSDHGEMLGDLGLLGKANMYEPAARVPLLMRLPGKALAGRRVDVPVSLVDIAPTVTAAAGMVQPQVFEGNDLASIATSPGDFAERVVHSHLFNPERGMYMIRDRRYKYIHSVADQTEQLFDLVEDPHEDVNLMEDHALEPVRERLKSALIHYLVGNNFTEGVLNREQTDWEKRPRQVISMPRTTSNHPCRWFEGKDGLVSGHLHQPVHQLL
jgi:choline-sulfatase